MCFWYRSSAVSAKEAGSPPSGPGSPGVDAFTRIDLPDLPLACQVITRHRPIRFSGTRYREARAALRRA
ncbi:hypothetical protein GCM10010420_14430 [Streptomyces glaucosporus]|uniref:Uncharacterized protein n=1 Tax=Streptomyces glaucosporus TaxID=284044 RepID=A0ABP5V3L0_9ACTN